MGSNPQKPKPQTIRAAATALTGAFVAATDVNVANAKEVELLLRFTRGVDPPPTNALLMIVEVVNDPASAGGDGLAYRRSIENGNLVDDTNYQGVDSAVNASIKSFNFVGVLASGSARVTYVVRVGGAKTLRFSFAETSPGSTPSTLGVQALLWLEGTD